MNPDRDGLVRHRAPGPVHRWLVAGGGAVLAGLVGVVLVLHSVPEGACATAPAAGVEHRGRASFYELRSGGGNCSYPTPPADGLYVALGPSQYDEAAACGSYLDVSGPRGSVRVKVTDRCPECEFGHLDLSRDAFARIADPVQGMVPIVYGAAVNPPAPGPLSFRIKEGASRYWFAVLVDNHSNPLRSVEAKGSGGTWREAVRQQYNYWTVEGGLGGGPFSIRVTDIYGGEVTATGITMSPGQVQQTSIGMTSSARKLPRSARPPTVRTPSASPTAARAISTVDPVRSTRSVGAARASSCR